jgi:tetratricopeptide (TPR) repeat protein
MSRMQIGLVALLGIAMTVGCGDLQSGSTGVTSATQPPQAKPAECRLAADALQRIREGKQAVKDGDWKKAIQLFEKAREIAPENPTVLHCLAMANEAEGNFLSAIAWHHAYAASLSSSSDVEQVRRHIGELKDAVRSQIREILACNANVKNRRWDYQRVEITALAFVGDRERAERILDEIKDPENRDRCNYALPLGLVYAGRAKEAFAIVKRHGVSTCCDHCCWRHMETGNWEEVEQWLPLLEGKDYGQEIRVRVGDVDNALKMIAQNKNQHSEARLDGLESQWKCDILRKASPDAIRKFIKARPEDCSVYLYEMVFAMIRWGYLSDAERAISLIPNLDWRCMATIDLLEAKAELKQITREQQCGQLLEMSKSENSLTSRLHLSCSLADVMIAQGKYADAKRRVDILGYLNSSKKLEYLHREMNGIDTGPPWECAAWAIVKAQAETAGPGEFVELLATSLLRLTGDRRDAAQVFLEIAETGAMPKKYASGVSMELAGNEAIQLRCRKGDFAVAEEKLKHFVGRWDTSLGPEMLSYAQTVATMAGAAFHQGNEELSRRATQELLTAWAIRLHCEPFHIADAAVPLAFNRDVKDLRDVVQFAVCRFAGKPPEQLVHRLAQLQELAGDVDGAKQTIDMGTHYSPKLEICGWTIAAHGIVHEWMPVSFREWLNRSLAERKNPDDSIDGELVIETLVRASFDLQNREDRWRRWQATHDDAPLKPTQ